MQWALEGPQWTQFEIRLIYTLKVVIIEQGQVPDRQVLGKYNSFYLFTYIFLLVMIFMFFLNLTFKHFILILTLALSR